MAVPGVVPPPQNATFKSLPKYSSAQSKPSIDLNKRKRQLEKTKGFRTSLFIATSTLLLTTATTRLNDPIPITYKANNSTIQKFLNKSSENEEQQPAVAADARHISSILDEAIEFGMKTTENLITIKEPQWYRMGLVLDPGHPASKVANFGAPNHAKAENLIKFGLASLEASKQLALSNLTGKSDLLQSRISLDDCPLRGNPRCPAASLRYRTSDGTCNNLQNPWRGSALLPMQRFLPPNFDDGIQSIRRSTNSFKTVLPSPRLISTRIHRDKNHEMPNVSLMFMQWGQFIDHDLTSTMKSRSFNGSTPRCCSTDGSQLLPEDITHPSCLPIEVPEDDWFLGRFQVRCMEFVRSAPSTRINCDLGWREQLNQVTSYLDASTIYGSDVTTSDSIRTFRNGKIIYGRSTNQPPDPPGGELCRAGALTTDCLEPGDGRASEQPGLMAMHTIFVRYHNKVAAVLSQINPHWSDEKTYQETRRIIYSALQHITYREFLPIVLGKEVMTLFDLNLQSKGYYEGYDPRVNPAIANSFSTAAYRFGHSLVQGSYVRFDRNHRPIFNNVTLHEDLDNLDNIWSPGSLDRFFLGLCNQKSQRRDEFISSELTNHLFQQPGTTFAPFGMDLAAINIQRGRDHGLPSYTSWRKPCGLSLIKTWNDLEGVMSIESTQRFRSLYHQVEDIDLYSGGLAEKPVRGGVVGPTFACIIAQQFLNLRRGDRFWYENGGFESALTPAQLQQIRRISLAQVLCQTLDDVDTIQPFVFLSHDSFHNLRQSCDSTSLNNFDLLPWAEKGGSFNNNKIEKSSDNILMHRANEELLRPKRKTKRKPSSTTTSTTTPKPNTTRPKPKAEPIKIEVKNVTSVQVENKYLETQPVGDEESINYLVGIVQPTRQVPQQQKPLEVNIKIQYYLPSSAKPKKKKRPSTQYPTVLVTSRPIKRPEPDYPVFITDSYSSSSSTKRPYYFEEAPFSTSQRPYIYRPNSDQYFQASRPYTSTSRPYFSSASTTSRPYYSTTRPYNQIYSSYSSTSRPDPYSYPSYNTNKRPDYTYNRNDPIHDFYAQVLENGPNYGTSPNKPTFGLGLDHRQDYTSHDISDKLTKPASSNTFYSISHVQKIGGTIHDKLDFKSHPSTFVKISSVKGVGQALQSKEGELDLLSFEATTSSTVNLVDLEVVPSEDLKLNHWMVFNATDEVVPQVVLPDINLNMTCSQELPRQMTD